MTRLRVFPEHWPLSSTFTIARGSKSSADVVVVELERDGVRGRGECVPYGHYGETVAGVIATIASMDEVVAGGLDRAALQRTMEAGAARNALDCALWDLEAKANGTAVAAMVGLEMSPVVTAYTLSLGSPEEMGRAARQHAQRPVLKLKLGGPEDLERVHAVRENAPTATLIVDANESWSAESVEPLSQSLHEAGVALIEQPLPAGADAMLEEITRPVPICADESCHNKSDLEAIASRYDAVNIKLDKTGGLTAALELQKAAQAAGLEVMVGCMVGTSLAMAPGMVLAQKARFVDLDGPLLLAKDRPEGLRFENGRVHPPRSELWG
jgi:L-alanine-DL-glutamate epimerase-like enolase superfamily enzyme